MPSEDELRFQMVSAVRKQVVSTIVHNRNRILAAMASQELNLELAQVSHLVTFYEAADGMQGLNCTPVPWYKGKPWPTNTEYHDRCVSLAGFGGRYRDEVLFDNSALLEKQLKPQGFKPNE